jgi:WD40 repeat protein
VEQLIAQSRRYAAHDQTLSVLLAAHAVRVGVQTAADDVASLDARQALIDALRAFAGPTRYSLGRSKGVVEAAALSPDERWAALYGPQDGLQLVSIDDVLAGRPMRPMIGKAALGYFPSTLFSSDGAWLATFSAAHDAELWRVRDFVDGRAVTPLPLGAGTDAAKEIAFSADGLNLVEAHESGIGIWARAGDAFTRRCTLPVTRPQLPIFVGNDNLVVFSSLDGVQTWRPCVDTKARVLGTAGSALALTAPRTGGRIAASYWDGSILVWTLPPDGAVPAPTTLRVHKGPVHHLALNADGTLLLSASHDRRLVLSNLRTATSTQLADATLYNAIAFTGDGAWIAASGEGAAHLWRMADVAQTPHREEIRGEKLSGLALGGRGSWLLTFGAGGGAVQDLASAGEIWRHGDGITVRASKGPMIKILVAPNSRYIAALDASSHLGVWTLEASKGGGAPHPRLVRSQDGVEGVDFSADSRWLAVARASQNDSSRDTPESGSIDLFNLEAPRSEPIGHYQDRWVSKVAFDPAARWLASGGGDGLVRLWRVEDFVNSYARPKPVLVGRHTLPVSALVYSPDGRWLATAARDGSAKIWRADAPQPGFDAKAAIVVEKTYEPPKLLFSADSRWAVALWWNVPALKIVDLHDPTPHWTDPAADAKIYDIAVSRDSRWLVAQTYEREWRLYDLLNKGPWSSRRRIDPGRRYLSFSADGRWLIGVGDKGVYLDDWRALVADQPAVPLIVSGVPGRNQSAATVTPDGDYVIVGDGDDALDIRTIGARALLTLARGLVERNLSTIEWSNLVQIGPYQKTFGDLN